MKIAILNNLPLTESNITELEKIGDVVFFEESQLETEISENMKHANVILTHCYSTPLTSHVFENTDSLEFISLFSTGYDNVDLVSAYKNKVQISNIPDYASDSVAEHTIALAMSLNRNISVLNSKMKEVPFKINPTDPSQYKFLGSNLVGKTIGIIGFGSIGKKVAEIADSLKIKVIFFNRTVINKTGFSQVSLDVLLKESDIVSLHLPLSPETEGIIGAKQFELMRPKSIFINTARANLINEYALIEALERKHLGGAALDVISNMTDKNKLLGFENVILTPHSSFFTKESIDQCARTAIDNVKAFINKKPINLIN